MSARVPSLFDSSLDASRVGASGAAIGLFNESKP